MLKARKQTARIMQRTVIAHVTPYSTGDMVISSMISFAWSDGGPLPLRKGKKKHVRGYYMYKVKIFFRFSAVQVETL